MQSISEAAQASLGRPYQYPFSSAETLLEDFKRLGSAADGSTYLDCLRSLITGANLGTAENPPLRIGLLDSNKSHWSHTVKIVVRNRCAGPARNDCSLFLPVI